MYIVYITQNEILPNCVQEHIRKSELEKLDNLSEWINYYM
jgi:hypothetical protein